MQECLDRMNLPDYILEILKCSKGVIVPKTRTDLFELAMGNVANTTYDVEYEVDGLGTVLEATITKCKNGAVVNYVEDYMRRRDPDCLFVADKKDTDKPKYEDVYNKDFETLRSFMPQWIAREYIARRGSAKFKPEHLVEARCSLLGFGLESLKIDGQYIRKAFLQPETQKEVGLEGYDAGTKILNDFFAQELKKYNTEQLNPLGRKIIDLFNNNAIVEQYMELIPMRY